MKLALCWLVVGIAGIAWGVPHDNPAEIIGGFMCALVAFATALWHDYDAYADVAHRPLGQHRVGEDRYEDAA